jgi:UDPglucose 6-dehydrogenase
MLPIFYDNSEAIARNRIMKIAVIGTGYVGLVAGVCFADSGHHVVCVDKVVEKVKKLQAGGVPIYEPGLEELLHLNQAQGRLEFTTDLAAAVQAANVVFIAVETPEKSDGNADMGPTMGVVDAICKAANSKKYVVMKSTVPVGTAKLVRERVANNSKFPIEVISNPEFLKEGAAIDDFLRPDRVVIGCSSTEAEDVMRELYDPFLKNGHPVLFMDNASAEMTKYAANAFLSVKISFINELALLADELGADINLVRKGFTSDSRINPAFFYPGVGFGGSCFPKDVKALVHTGLAAGIPMQVVQAADEVNDRQKLVLFHRMKEHFGDLRGKTIAMWGLAFKPRTDDVREAPALYLIEKLVEAGAKVRAYDPVANETATAASKVKFEAVSTAMAAVEGADALAIVTEWNEFRTPDLAQLKAVLKSPVIFDGRNVLDPVKIKEAGFKYYCIGRQASTRLETKRDKS